MLVLVITTASAYLRLSQYGLGCADWPACYGKNPLEQAVLSESSPQFWVRAIHRVAATIAGLVFVAVAVFWWGEWRTTRERILSFAPLILAAFLAWLGRYTPSTLPAVTLGNLLGGMATLGVVWWLRAAAVSGAANGSAVSPVIARAAAIALLFLFVQIALGGLMGARLAAVACPDFPDCGAGPQTLSAGLIDPFAHVPVESTNAAARRGLHMAHRWSGLLLAAMLVWVGVTAVRNRGPQRGPGRWLLGLVSVQVIAGASMVLAGLPLALAVVHNVTAGLLILALVSLLAVRVERTGPPST